MKLKIKTVFHTVGSYSSSISNSEHYTSKSESRGCQNLPVSLRQQNNYEHVIISIKSEKKKYFKGMVVTTKPISHSSASLAITISPYAPGTAPFLSFIQTFASFSSPAYIFIFISSVPEFSQLQDLLNQQNQKLGTLISRSSSLDRKGEVSASVL